ncbi:MAG TPA: L-threonylcarbamoyladenylate synthase [Candidatus Saccharimonadales bacterium]|nr:L-threonylcarbamoyladenylate synthase [Candidatus Saccharimonadales bacterium]
MTSADLEKPGTIGVIPTDTVYGLVARAADEAAVSRLYELKERDDKPGTLIAADIGQLEELGLKRRYLRAVEQFWPGPVSVVIPADPALSYLHKGRMSLAVRIPKDKKLQELLKKTGPLVTSSANHPGKPVAVTIKQAKDYFGDKVDFYVDGDDLSGQEPSTIIRIVDDAIEVLREGAVKISDDTISP